MFKLPPKATAIVRCGSPFTPDKIQPLYLPPLLALSHEHCRCASVHKHHRSCLLRSEVILTRQAGVSIAKRGLSRTLSVSCLILAASQLVRCQTPDKSEKIRDLLQRVSTPTAVDLHAFEESGMKGVRPHILSAGEQAKLGAALARLPALNLDALSTHLHRFGFVDGIPGEGTGLTGPAANRTQYDMTLRASLFEESLSDFLTRKENFVFAKGNSGVEVIVVGTGTDALTYVLLHESTHVLDLSCGITAAPQNKFAQHIWSTPDTLVPSLRGLLATQTHFRGKPYLSLAKAPDLYTSLAKSPFVSLYSTASAREDLAELVAHREIFLNYGGDFTISVRLPGHKDTLTWHPLTFPSVQARLTQVDKLEQTTRGCPRK